VGAAEIHGMFFLPRTEYLRKDDGAEW
jgi:hypothetical protein